MLRILEHEIPGITAQVRRLTAPQLRRLARATARLAARSAPVDDRRVRRGLAALESDSVDPAITEQLWLLVNELDHQAAAMLRDLDAVEHGAEPDLERRYTHTLMQARAVEAVIGALDPDVNHAVQNSLYEAHAALHQSPAAIRAIIDAVAGGVDDPVDYAARQVTPEPAAQTPVALPATATQPTASATATTTQIASTGASDLRLRGATSKRR